MIRVLVADDHPVVRGGIKQALSDSLAGVVIGEACTVQELFEQVEGRRWDVIILDITMPGGGGLEALKRLKQERPSVPVLMLSVYSEDQFAVRAIQAGASGYLTKKSLPEELVRAVKTVLGGGKYLTPTVADLLATHLQHNESDAPPHTRLSDREYQVFRALVRGKTVSEIAEELALSIKTVSTYRTRILEKLDVKTNTDLARYAFRHHLED